MSFVTNKYTRPVLRTELKKVSASNFTSLATLAKVISPRAGIRSAKIAAIRSSINTSLSSVFIATNGENNKSVLLNLLKNS